MLAYKMMGKVEINLPITKNNSPLEMGIGFWNIFITSLEN